MTPEVKLLHDMDQLTYDFLLQNLTGITEEELDWRPHPEANPVRWIVGHLLWYEEWACDAIEGTGTYLSERWPSAVEVPALEPALERFGAARQRYSRLFEEMTGDDLSRTIDYFGTYRLSLEDLAAVHALHLSGHQYQIRYIRGTFSRDRGTEKAAFDPW